MSWIALSCKKNDTPVKTDDPIITDVGTPIGDATTATIGPSGGTIQSTDGNLSISIPQDALSSATQISIQPITNTAPSGLGSGYSLLPEGTTFSKPVQLTFHYDTTILNGVNQNFLWIVTQASNGSWNAMLNCVIDTISKTVTVESTHFSPWILGNFFSISPSSKIVKKGEVVNLKLTYFSPAKSTEGNGNSTQLSANTADSGDEDLTPLLPKALLNCKFRIKSWTMNGSPAPVSNSYGSLSASGINATYTAPKTIPKKNIVAISANLDLIDTNGKLSHPIYNSILTIHDYYLNLKIDGETYNYKQGDDTATAAVGAAYLNNTLYVSANITGKSGDATHLFDLSFYNPSKTTRFLVPTGFNGKDAIVFAPTGVSGAQYSLEIHTRAKDSNNSCNTKGDYGKFSLTLTTCGYDVDLSKKNKADIYDFAGSFSGTIYEDHQEFIDNCHSSLPHSISGDFNLIAESH
jgi:hypothetical protein